MAATLEQAGLYEGHHTGRKRKWMSEQQEALPTLALADGGGANSLLRTMAQTEGLPAISQKTSRRYLHEMQFSYKCYRYSLKKASSGSVLQGGTDNWRVGSTGTRRAV